MNSKKIFLKTALPILKDFGYEYFEDPTVQERGLCFLRKDLGNRLFAFIGFQQMSYVKAIIDGKELPHRFDIRLWRTFGPHPHDEFGLTEPNMDNWLFINISYLLWTVLDLQIYEKAYHLWEYHNEEELIIQLNDALDKLVKYGLPWLEDPNSKNPYEDAIVEGGDLPKFVQSSRLKTYSLSQAQASVNLNGGIQMDVNNEVSGLYDCLCDLLAQAGLSWFRLSLNLIFKDLALESLSFSWIQRGRNRLADPIPSISIRDLQNKIILYIDEMGMNPDRYILNVVSEAYHLPEAVTSQFKRPNEGYVKQTTRIGKRTFTIQIGAVPPTA